MQLTPACTHFSPFRRYSAPAAEFTSNLAQRQPLKTSPNIRQNNKKIPTFPQTFPPPHRLNSRDRCFKKGGTMPPQIHFATPQTQPTSSHDFSANPNHPPSPPFSANEPIFDASVFPNKATEPPAAQQKPTQRNISTRFRQKRSHSGSIGIPNQANSPPAAQRTAAHHGAPFFALFVKSNPPATLAYFAPSSQWETRLMPLAPHHHQPPKILFPQPPLPSPVY
jgi:hypothetical protein